MSVYSENGSISYDAGDIGGDVQASNSIGRQFWTDNNDGTNTIIDVFAYVSDEFMSEDRDPENRFWDFQVATFTATVDARTGEEQDSDVSYENSCQSDFSDAADALAAARSYMEALDTDHF